MNPLDRRIISLALPALGSLAVEPIYVLVDTAIVGRLGTQHLAGLAGAAPSLSSGKVQSGLSWASVASAERLSISPSASRIFQYRRPLFRSDRRGCCSGRPSQPATRARPRGSLPEKWFSLVRY